jgi:hypothetical protein
VEPEPQRDAAPAPTAPNLMFNIGRLSKMSQQPHQNDAASQHWLKYIEIRVDTKFHETKVREIS